MMQVNTLMQFCINEFSNIWQFCKMEKKNKKMKLNCAHKLWHAFSVSVMCLFWYSDHFGGTWDRPTAGEWGIYRSNLLLILDSALMITAYVKKFAARFVSWIGRQWIVSRQKGKLIIIIIIARIVYSYISNTLEVCAQMRQLSFTDQLYWQECPTHLHDLAPNTNKQKPKRSLILVSKIESLTTISAITGIIHKATGFKTVYIICRC